MGYDHKSWPFFCFAANLQRSRIKEKMEEITIDKIVRSRRRTITLVVTQDATLVVRAPLRASISYIESVVKKKSAWIRKKLFEASQRPKAPAREYVDGEEFLYLGRAYKLCFVERAGKDIELTDKLCLSGRVKPIARYVIRRWYKAAALKIIGQRCQWYADATSYKPAAINITEARKRWGSCGSKGTLNFSWRLIMAPQEVIDYVIVHELAHIGQLNHSPAFWDRVAGILPDYRKMEKWLKENGCLLVPFSLLFAIYPYVPGLSIGFS
jgi:predicted metal-dependent hydrolase